MARDGGEWKSEKSSSSSLSNALESRDVVGGAIMEGLGVCVLEGALGGGRSGGGDVDLMKDERFVLCGGEATGAGD